VEHSLASTLCQETTLSAAVEEPNVTLLVSNQSFAVDPVEIEIAVDGEVVVRDAFEVAGDQPPQHNWREYHPRLQPGTHRLVATANDGAELETTFEVAGDHTIAVAHWTEQSSAAGTEPKGYFTVESEPRPIAMM
jgi:hypothetical protein